MRQASKFLRVFLRTQVRKQFGVFVALAMMFVGFFGNVARVHATAASLTMESNLTLVVAQTTSVPTLTFTDDSDTPSVTATNDLYLQIPATIHGVWDSSVTGLTIAGTAGAKVSLTPEYVSTTIVKLDVTSDLLAGETITIAGLQMTGVDSGSPMQSVLKYSVDGGGTYAFGSGLPGRVIVNPASMTTVQTPTSLGAYVLTTYSFAFTTVAATPADGLIKMVFPNDVDLSNVTGTDGTCSTMNGSFSTGVSGQTVTITRSGGDADAAGAQVCTIANIRNYVGTVGTGTFKVETSSGENGIIETSTVAATTFVSNSLSASVVLSEHGMGLTGNATVTFTNVGALPGGAKVKVTFPSGFSIGNVATATCSGIDGTLTPSVAGRTVTFERSTLDPVSVSAAHTCTIPNVTNPNVTGSTDYFTVITTNNSDITIDQSTTVPRVDIFPIGVSPAKSQTPPPGPVTSSTVASVGDGTAALIEWVNPADAMNGVHIYRSEISNVLGSLVATTGATDTSFTDSGLTIGKTYYYILRPFTNASGDNQSVSELAYKAFGVVIEPFPQVEEQLPIADEPLPPVRPAPVPLPDTPDVIQIGDLVRGDLGTVYYVASDAKRYVFPHENVFYSWYDNYFTVKKVKNETLMALPLGGTVRLRPGVQLVKIVSDPKVFAIEPGGVLRWVSSEALAVGLFGEKWNRRVIDVDDSLFVNYTIGAPIETPAYPVGSVVHVLNEYNDYYYINRTATGTLFQQRFVDSGLKANRYGESRVFATSSNYLLNGPPLFGSKISTTSSMISDPVIIE